MLTWKRVLTGLIALVVLLQLIASLALPGFVSRKASEWVASETGRTLSIGALDISLLSLAVDIDNLVLSEPSSQQPFVTFERLHLALSPASLWRRAPIIRELRLVKPDIRLEKRADGSFNFSDFIPPADDSPAQSQEQSEATRFSLNNLTVSQGRIDFSDYGPDEAVHHRIRDLELAVPFIGNLPYLVDKPVQPQLEAVVNGSPIYLDGELKPFAAAQEVQVELALNDIDLTRYIGYVPIELPVSLKSGRLNLDLELTYRVSSESRPQLSLNGDASLTTVNVYDRAGEQLFFLPLLQCRFAPVNLLDNQLQLTALHLYNLEVQLKRDRNGVWNHSRLSTKESPREAPEAPAGAESGENEESQPFRLAIDDLKLRDGVVFFDDAFPPGGFKTTASDVNLDLKNFALGNATAMPLSASLRSGRGETLAVDGLLSLAPLTLSLDVLLNNLPLAPYQPYYSEVAAVPLQGTADLAANLAVTPDKSLLVSAGELVLRDFKAPFTETDALSIAETRLENFSFDLDDNRFVADNLKTAGAEIGLTRDDSGQLSPFAGDFPVFSPTDGTPAATASEPTAFSFLLRSFALSGWDITFNDQLPRQPARLQVRDLTLALENLALPQAVESPLKLSAQLPPKGRLDIDGSVVLAQQTGTLHSRARRLPLKPLAPYLAEQSNLVLTGGDLSSELTTHFDASARPLTLDFSGRLGLSRLRLLDGSLREELLKWNSLQVAGIRGQLDPAELTIDSITLSDYFAKLLVDEKARLNLVEAFKPPATEADGANKTVKSEDAVVAETPQQTTARPDIRIGKVVLQGGQVDFTDRHLPRPFYADMRELGGRIDGLSSDPGSQAEVDLRGRLSKRSPLTISGTINPLAEQLALALKLDFRDIEMSPFSPYSGTFVGYMIDKGKLNLALDYTIEDNQLRAANTIFLDQFEFGQSVDSEQATSLPVKLAVALLKDGAGEIHLDIPVYGSLDDPQFSIAGVIWTVVRNLLVKAATSPLALLGALVGGGDEDFSSVAFELGSARLSASEQDKLLRMAQALNDRPSLDVEVSGFIDPEQDAEGYRRELLSSKLRQLRYRELVKDDKLPEGVTAQNIELPVGSYADYLWQVYREEKFPKPRNFIGMTKKLPEAEMEKLIYANTPVKQQQLEQLALKRAQAVQNFLIEQGKLAGERVFLKKPDISAAPDAETAVRARVELGASVH
jgi:uncharacterized protein involved in outer membrane biogenesis